MVWKLYNWTSNIKSFTKGLLINFIHTSSFLFSHFKLLHLQKLLHLTPCFAHWHARLHFPLQEHFISSSSMPSDNSIIDLFKMSSFGRDTFFGLCKKLKNYFVKLKNDCMDKLQAFLFLKSTVTNKKLWKSFVVKIKKIWKTV